MDGGADTRGSGLPPHRLARGWSNGRTVTLDHEKSYIKWGEGRRGEGGGGTANPCSQQLVRVEATRAQKTKHGGGRGAKKDQPGERPPASLAPSEMEERALPAGRRLAPYDGGNCGGPGGRLAGGGDPDVGFADVAEGRQGIWSGRGMVNCFALGGGSGGAESGAHGGLSGHTEGQGNVRELGQVAGRMQAWAAGRDPDGSAGGPGSRSVGGVTGKTGGW
jgi:hypothetical protein